VAIVGHHGGDVPSTVQELLRLPGIGEYTARAVAAFAFGARVPVVDTNVRRVLARVVRGVDEPRTPASAADRAEMARCLPADPSTAARFSVAVMELGALVCTASRPDCARCPLRQSCRWRLTGAPDGLARRPVQAWHGTDRQVRGRIMAALLGSDEPVAELDLLGAGADGFQARRCLDSLLVDGLIERAHPGRYQLPS
jgi:A/G-specific adenine glycosylase